MRSFDVPADDPAAARMTNLSWTYDSAIAAIALISQNEKTQAEQLLDQLAALQRTDGSIDFAYNVADGSSLPVFNTGAIAWTGVAAAMYRSTYDSNTVRRARGRHHQVAAQPPALEPACSPAPRRRPGSRPSTTSSPGT